MLRHATLDPKYVWISENGDGQGFDGDYEEKRDKGQLWCLPDLMAIESNLYFLLLYELFVYCIRLVGR